MGMKASHAFSSLSMTDKGKIINTKVNDVERLAKLVADSYRGLQKSVQMAFLYALLLAVRELKSYVLKMRNQLLKDLHDEYGLDYLCLERKVLSLATDLETLTNLPGLKELWNDRVRWKQSPQQVADDERDFDFENCDSINLRNINTQLWENQYSLINNIVEGLQAIGGYLKEIHFEEEYFSEEVTFFEEEYSGQSGAIKDWEKYPIINNLKNRYQNIEEAYMSEQWPYVLNEFKVEVRDFISDHQATRECYERFARTYARKASTLASLDPQEKCIYVEVFSNRKNYRVADIHDAIGFNQCQRLLEARIEAFSLLEPADDAYSLLFVNKAAQKLMLLLVPYIKEYIKFPHNYHYAALLFAMIDFGITPDPANNGKQMLAFVNQHLKDRREPIADETSITQKKKLALGKMFGTIIKGNYGGTQFKDNSFESLRDTYWACFTLLNYIFEKDIRQEGFANYLVEPHDNTCVFSQVLKQDSELHHQIQILKSVIDKETADF